MANMTCQDVTTPYEAATMSIGPGGMIVKLLGTINVRFFILSHEDLVLPSHYHRLKFVVILDMANSPAVTF